MDISIARNYLNFLDCYEFQGFFKLFVIKE